MKQSHGSALLAKKVVAEKLENVIRDSIVASIPACHAGDRGSIPRRGEYLLQIKFCHHDRTMYLASHPCSQKLLPPYQVYFDLQVFAFSFLDVE